MFLLTSNILAKVGIFCEMAKLFWKYLFRLTKNATHQEPRHSSNNNNQLTLNQNQMYESGAKVQCFSFAIDKICFKDIQKSFTVTYLLAMND